MNNVKWHEGVDIVLRFSTEGIQVRFVGVQTSHTQRWLINVRVMCVGGYGLYVCVNVANLVKLLDGS